MDKITKALDVVSKTKNPLIKKAMITVLRKEFKHLQNSLDAACNHNEELENDISEANRAVKGMIQAINDA